MQRVMPNIVTDDVDESSRIRMAVTCTLAYLEGVATVYNLDERRLIAETAKALEVKQRHV